MLGNQAMGHPSPTRPNLHSQERAVRSLFTKRTDQGIQIGVKALSKPIQMFNEKADLDTPQIEDCSSEREMPKSATIPQMSRKSK